MARAYHQGTFNPINPHKYVGDPTNIVYRSSWEKKVMIWFDTNPSVIRWASEEMPIPYISPIDNRPHRYFVDFLVEYKKTDGTICKAAVEVKPHAQTLPPQQPKRVTKQFVESVQTYAVNEAKWKAAIQWCKSRGWEFIILTEREIFPSKSK